MLSLQTDHRQHQLQQQQQQFQLVQVPRVSYNGDQRDDSFVIHSESSLASSNLKLSQSLEPREVDEDVLLALAHQNYKAGNYKHALEHSNAVYERNPLRTDNLLLLGAIYYQLHDFDMCVAKNEEALRIDPHFAECYGNMANAWKEKGNTDLAIRCYLVAIELRPNFADAWSNLASAYMRKGRLNEAAQCCRQALALNPHLVDAHSNLGNLMKAQGLVQEAYNCYAEALRIQPTFAIAWSNLAGLFMEAGDLNRALQYYKEAVKLKPTFPDACLNLGNVYKALGMPQEAIVCYQRALQARPDYAMAFGNLASIYYEQGKLDLAILHYKRAIACDTGFLEAYNNMGNALKDAGKVEEAIHCYHQCLNLQPSHPQALTNLGNIYMEWNMMSAAAQYYNKTLTVTTGLSAPFSNLAVIYKQQGNYADALSCYNEVDPMLALEISRKYAAHCSVVAARYTLPPFSHPSPLPIRGGGRSGRLRVGYVSSDFGNHPLSHLMGSVFGTHNRENIEVFCYALSPNDGTEWRLRIQSEAEHFVDVSSMSADMIARMINDDQIHILVNLNGYTKGARNEIFAMQPAPIQVSYMGFPGTTGASYIHYLVTDEFVSPTRFSHIYSEKLVHLPHCYFVNDYKQKNRDVLDPNCQPKRSDYGLPNDKFIFACFNQLYKMDPEIFTTWCNILKRVPNSAIWFLRFPAAGEMRVRTYAAAQGVQPDQIIFTDVAMKNEHIRRSSLADLFLDTPLCNAHTTGTDILWAGLPMVTLPLEKMATRVAGSLCLATGVGEEMVANSMEEYEEKAVSLALNHSKLQDLTDRLKASRLTCPLFDTARWVKNLERAYYKMWNLYCSGQHPQPFKVTENDSEFPYDR
ncbi:UDP-N-acetylglucosamine--peptide N-acetylglucosaminyltransferase like [Actinidia chinensis var. chinensis]|uniref:protein O-GlcNAc transferase n=1 Tax=Actinidia chinensis var. chinensis TaxID=1590841 RepID=A0A2R6S027_ACTCC|nr:UDP-N-acetylglucosamine--peptide N-acetylglucosaminyltransferase like [Actinidia chinensis var. chinensis]